MAKEKSPAFQLYVKDFLTDTAHLTNEQVGIYARWLCFAWTGISDCQPCELPDDDEILRRLVAIGRKKMASTGVQVKELFRERRDGKIIHKRLRKEKEKQDKHHEQRRLAGEASAEARKRKDNDRSTTVEPPLEPRDNESATLPLPLPSSSSSSLAAAEEEKKYREKNFGIGLLLLQKIGMDRSVAVTLADAYTVERIFHVTARARTMSNPAGFARQALEQNFPVPEVELAALAAILSERVPEESAPEVQKPKTERLPDESDDDFLRRLQEEARNR